MQLLADQRKRLKVAKKLVPKRGELDAALAWDLTRYEDANRLIARAEGFVPFSLPP